MSPHAIELLAITLLATLPCARLHIIVMSNGWGIRKNTVIMDIDLHSWAVFCHGATFAFMGRTSYECELDLRRLATR